MLYNQHFLFLLNEERFLNLILLHLGAKQFSHLPNLQYSFIMEVFKTFYCTAAFIHADEN